ncbi:MAG: multiheme c-type cytochrome [Candidatus Rokuibacteriota bacterium]
MSRSRLVLALVVLGLGSALPGSAQRSPGGSEAEVRAFLTRHWQTPIPAQGTPPARFSTLEASLHPAQCGTCHPSQLAEWRTSYHARAMGPGVAGQLVEMAQQDPEAARQCASCHAPLHEQQERIADDRGGHRANPAFDATLRAAGLVCAACHVRGHQRFGPPRRDGSLVSELPRETLPHNGVTRTPAFVRAEFCQGCHQFPEDGFALNGKLLENTYNEWKASRFARAGTQCQDCHMPDRRHLWRGIHDPDTVRSGLTITFRPDRDRYRPGETVTATLTVTNSGVGHHFPTYVTPRVVARVELRDAQGRTVPGSVDERIIARAVTLDLSREVRDTRLAPGQSFVLRYRRALKTPGARLRAVLTVYPDHFYTGFFESVLAQAAGRGTDQVREALAATRRSAFVVYEKERRLN